MVCRSVGGTIMADYRLYLLTAADRIDRAIILTCVGDDQALAEMAQHAAGSAGAELWLMDRLVHRSRPAATPA